MTEDPIPSGLELAGALWALGAGVWAPGAALVGALGLGRDALERGVLAFALGRVLFGAVALAAVSTVGAVGIHLWSGLGALAWLIVRLRAGRTAAGVRPRELALPLAVASLAAALLVVAVVARGGLPGPEGGLVFHGRDSTNDPLVYSAIALELFEGGLPLAYPFTGGASTTSTYLPYGTMVGLHAFGVPMLDVNLRVLPLAEAWVLGLTGVALVRRLGGGPGAAALGAGLVLLGGDPGAWLGPLASLVGREAQALDGWGLFGPYLLAFNPATSALQLAFAALLLLGGPAGAGRRVAMVAGGLVAAAFETKLFVWAPLLGALVAVAWIRPPAALATRLRLASVVAAAASLPSLVEKALWADAFRGRDVTAFVACPGCLPRYLADASLGSRELGFEGFVAFSFAQLLEPRVIVETAAASVLLLVVALGARAFGVPVLWRGARADDGGRAAIHRVLGMAAALGLAGALTFTTAPHYLNGAQFAWLATVGLWPAAAIALARGAARRRLAACVGAALLMLPGTWRCLVDLGVAAPRQAFVPAAELALVEALRARSAPGELVLEPSMLANTDFPSPVTWLAGRPVALSLLSAVQILPEAELLARHRQLVAVFAGVDARAGRAAIAASGARWILAPALWPLRFDPGPGVEVVLRRPAGTLYRVRPGAYTRSGPSDAGEL